MYTTLIEAAAARPRSSCARQPIPNSWCSTAVTSCRSRMGRSRVRGGPHSRAPFSAHLDRDLSGPVDAPRPAGTRCRMQRSSRKRWPWGIDDGVQVVAYDQGNGAYAARAWWMLRWLGHKRVAVLDGGFAAWQEAGLPVSTRARRSARHGMFTAHAPSPGCARTHDSRGAAGAGAQGHHAHRRARRRSFRRRERDDRSSGGPRARRDRTARSRKNVDGRGRFLPAAELRRQWTEALAGKRAEEVVAHVRLRRQPHATTCSRSRSRVSPARASTRVRGASGSAIPHAPIARGPD